MDMTPQTWPEWYDGRHINEVLFCQQFLDKHPMKCVRGRLFTVDGLIEDEGQIGNLILEEISRVLTSGLSKVVTNLLASIKLQAYSPPLPIETDRIHVAKKGLISDRCELNRQIKADNALLRDLKATVRKLMQAVKNTIPAIAEAMETIRQNVIIFCYQLRSIRTGQRKLKTYISDVKSEMKQYSSLVEQIKEKSKERKSLLAEQKELPFWNIPRKKELTSRIAELSELLEELHSEKAIVLQYLQCTDESGVSAVKKGITATETELKKLDEQEEKYAAELDAALKQYADLKEQAVEHDPVELYDARQAIRHEKEQNVINRVQRAYGDKYNPLAMFDSKREVSGLLHEYADEQAVRDLKRKQHKYQKEHSQIQPKKTRDEQSR